MDDAEPSNEPTEQEGQDDDPKNVQGGQEGDPNQQEGQDGDLNKQEGQEGVPNQHPNKRQKNFNVKLVRKDTPIDLD
eukprot:4999218-Alexandrium_andersonii.AAC.1